MSEIRTQSRPYAEAAFEVALADDTLDAWTADFSLIELALEDQKISQLVETPSISQSEKTNIFYPDHSYVVEKYNLIYSAID